MNNYVKMCYLLKCARLARQMSTVLSNRPNLYELLGVSPQATATEIKKAYFEKTKLYHPDVATSTEESLKIFREISEAYEVLGSPTLRKEYDQNVLGLSRENLENSEEEDPISSYKRTLNNEKMYSWTKEHYSVLRKQQFVHQSRSYAKSDKKPVTEKKDIPNFQVNLLLSLFLSGLILIKIFNVDDIEKFKIF